MIADKNSSHNIREEFLSCNLILLNIIYICQIQLSIIITIFDDCISVNKIA